MNTIARDALEQRTTEIAREAVAERLRAADLGYDAEHDARHGYAHTVEWGIRYLAKSLTSEPDLRDAREQLLKAAGLVLASIDIIDSADTDRAGD